MTEPAERREEIVVTQEMIDAGREAYHQAARMAACVDFAGNKIVAAYRAMRALEPAAE